jgi:hypothetical protein
VTEYSFLNFFFHKITKIHHTKNHWFFGTRPGLGSSLNKQSYSDSTLVLGLYLTQRRGVSQRGLAIYIKVYLKAKVELWKLIYFTVQK